MIKPRLQTYPLFLLAASIASATAMAAFVELDPTDIYDEMFPMWMYTQSVADEKADSDPDRLLVGDSRLMAGVFPKELGEGTRLLALPGGSPVELYFTVRRYLEHNAAPQRVLLALTAPHCIDDELFWERGVKFDYFESSEVAEIQKVHDEIYPSPLDRAEYRLKYASYRWRLPPLYYPEIRSVFLEGHRDKNRRVLATLERTDGHFEFGQARASAGLSYEPNYETFHVDPVVDRFLGKLIDLLTAKGVTVHFQTMPINRASYAALKPQFVKEYVAYHRALAKKHEGFDVDTHWTVWPNDHFGDPNHLNAKGARRFTALLKSGTSF